MLKTCDQCRLRDYCEHCADQETCYWRKLDPGNKQTLSCESYRCKHYDECRKQRPEHRRLQ